MTSSKEPSKKSRTNRERPKSASPSVEVPPPEPKPELQNWNREKSAAYLGISVATLRRHEDAGDVTPFTNGKGHHSYSLEQLQRLKLELERRKSPPGTPRYDPLQAAAAFELFEQGLGPADAVRRVPCSPPVAESLHHEWARLKNFFIVDGTARLKIEEFGTKFGQDVTIADELLNLLETALLAVGDCSCCGRGVASFCARCCLSRANDVRERAAKALEDDRAIAERNERQRLERELVRRATDGLHKQNAANRAPTRTSNATPAAPTKDKPPAATSFTTRPPAAADVAPKAKPASTRESPPRFKARKRARMSLTAHTALAPPVVPRAEHRAPKSEPLHGNAPPSAAPDGEASQLDAMPAQVPTPSSAEPPMDSVSAAATDPTKQGKPQ